MSKEKQKIEVGDWVKLPNSKETGLVVCLLERFSLAGFNCEVSFPWGISYCNTDNLVICDDCFAIKQTRDLHAYVDILLKTRTPRDCLVFLINDLPIDKLLKHLAISIGYFEPILKHESKEELLAKVHAMHEDLYKKEQEQKGKKSKLFSPGFLKFVDALNISRLSHPEEKPASTITEKITFHEVPKWWESCVEADEEHCACCGDCEDVEITGSEKETPYPDQPFSEMTVRDHMACQIFPHVAKINKIDKTDDMAAFVEHIHEIVDLMLKNKGSK